MPSPTSTFATLRALHMVIGDALDDIHRVFSQNALPDPPPSPTSQCSSPLYASSPEPSPATSQFPTTPPTSSPPTPLSATFPPPSHSDTRVPIIDYPSPNMPFVSNAPSEQLALHPDAHAAASRIVAACGQMSIIVHRPFLSLCDALMSYNLPACIRLVEHLHVAEILREAEDNRQRCLAGGQESRAPLAGGKVDPNLEVDEPSLTRTIIDSWTPEVISGPRVHKDTEGLHVADLTDVICSHTGIDYIDPSDLVHALRLLSTHHIFRETAPDTFALTRVASLLDSGKSVQAVFSSSDTKYEDTDGIAAFVALTADELFKSAAYLTEAFTGVQLPTLGCSSLPIDTALSGKPTIPSTSSYATNDPALRTPVTCCSGVVTPIMYPEDEDFQPPSRLLSSTESLEDITSYPLPNHAPTRSRPLTTEPSVLPLSPTPVEESSTQLGKDRGSSGIAAEQKKLPAFNLALRTAEPFFEWLENGGEDPLGGTGRGRYARTPTRMGSIMRDDVQRAVPKFGSQKSFRLQRFSNAMTGTTGWEAPKAILSGFDWNSLPKCSTIVDVGGGIGSTTMILAHALNNPSADSVRKQDSAYNVRLKPSSSVAAHRHRSKLPSDPSLIGSDEPQGNTAAKNDTDFRFVVQDKPVVTALGIVAWRSKSPEMLESGQVEFQDQDFFEPQPPLRPPHITKYPAVYLLRVVLHDWPDEVARRILINLRVASNPETRLVIAEHVLPLACVDRDVLNVANSETHDGSNKDGWTLHSVLANIEGAERTLVPPPLLPNLGKASANAYSLDLIMHIIFNGKERTLREFCALALSAGWRITRMTRPESSLFTYLVCEPITLPDDAQAIYNAVVLSCGLSTVVPVVSEEPMPQSHVKASHDKQLPAPPMPLLPSPFLQRSSSRCGTPSFGSRTLLPKDEELQSPRSKGTGAKKWFKSKGLGVRNVMMQKAEKQRDEHNSAKGASLRDQGDMRCGVPASPSHTRVWWKKPPPSSTSSSSTAIDELNGQVPEHRLTGRGRLGTLKANNTPSTPLQSPRVSPVQHTWPSKESAAFAVPEVSPPVPHTRRPSVAGITRKLSFATFGRRPSIADVTEPLPTPPHSAMLAPPPTLQGDAGRKLKHLPSLPTLVRSEVSTGKAAGEAAIPRRPSLSFADHVLPPQPVPKACLGLPKSGILVKSPGVSSSASKQSSPGMGHSTESALNPRRQRSVTLSNSPAASSTQTQTPGGVSVPPDPAGPEVKRTPNMPHHLSIPLLRRKQSHLVIQDAEEGERAY